MSDTHLTDYLDFLRAFVSAQTPTKRGELCRTHLAYLLPSDPIRRAKVYWNALNLGKGDVARIGIVETVADRPGARLLLTEVRRSFARSGSTTK
ncbi:MAG: hypothetical protein IPK17_38700 [Chloroflexi bacterium]|uniref:hypothetical protein n=1 Tax=Candidatus Flexifilum breve TaxID=3140694 RepID=UPI00313748BB|nr:hypothetical protein [Chloroflexota bacterium]